MRTNENIIKNLLLIVSTIISASVLIACADTGTTGKAAISDGRDIPIMPTTANILEQETETPSLESVKMIIIDIDTEEKTMVLQSTETDVRLQYTYTGGTDILSRYGEPILPDRLIVGEVVDVWSAQASSKLDKIQISSEDFDYSDVTNFKVDTGNMTLTVGSQKYTYTDNTVVVSGNREISVDKLESIDVLKLRGVDKELDSIIVTQGHGYLRLDSTTFFEGGYLEIGDKIVELITENMVLPVPVGRYTIKVSKDSTSGSKEVVIADNEEMRINLTEFQSTAVRLGTLSFKINPQGAKLTIDGIEKDYSQIIDVAYGKHKIVVTAEGYEPYAQVITVDSILSEYNITLVRESENSGDNNTGETDDYSETGSSSGNGSNAEGNASGDDRGNGGNAGVGSNSNNNNSIANSGAAATTRASSIRETTTSIQTIDYSRLLDTLFG